MKILVFADSHGRNIGMLYAVEQEKPDAVIHLGDHVGDARDIERAYPLLPVYRVRGNNDFEPDVALSAAITPDNVPIYITHGHKERASMLSCGIVPQKAREEGCGFAFFGHTHRMLLERIDGVVVCNPGSISLPRGGPASYARLFIEDSRVESLELADEDGGLLRRERFGR
ncbi:MAG: metallophosphoesterase [Eubacteriales bacterium]|nr:metallophosphoesterase [Eubacteriales bacterium]